VALTVSRFGRLDAVAALAGAGIHGHPLDLGPADWRRGGHGETGRCVESRALRAPTPCSL
jgi:hypothetical protein